jgi:hypothetical protein
MPHQFCAVNTSDPILEVLVEAVVRVGIAIHVAVDCAREGSGAEAVQQCCDEDILALQQAVWEGVGFDESVKEAARRKGRC